MKKVLKLMAFMMTLMSLFGCKKASDKTIAIVKLGEHTSLNEIHEAVTSTLEAKGYTNILNYSADFDNSIANELMYTIKDKADIVVAITTPVAQSAYAILDEKTPIVFSAVSDPIGAKLLTSLEKPSENITGTSDEIQIDLILDRALEIDPNLKKLGFIYNPGEANSVSNKKKIEDYCKNKQIEFVPSVILNAGEMSEVALSLVNKVDAIFITDDNTVASSMSVLGEICREKKIPCYTGADSEVIDGGMLCVGINYTSLGIETANMVDAILKGKAIKDIPVKVFKENLKIYLNESFVEDAGIIIPQSILGSENLVKIKDKD